MSTSQTQFQRKRITDPHPVFTVQHEGDRACNVRIKCQCNQVKHVLVVDRRFIFVGDFEIEMIIILRLDRDIDPLLGGLQARFDFTQRCQVLIHGVAIRLP